MGLRGLEKFIRNNSNIVEPIQIRDEIAKWRHENEKDPIILIDLQEFWRFMGHIEKDGLSIGGQFEQINQKVEYFFSEIIDCQAKIIFIARMDEKRMNSIDKYQSLQKTYDFISANGDMKKHKFQISSALHPIERIQYNVLHICAKYGDVIATYTSAERSILAYAREKHDQLMAVITRNTEYFIYDANFEYWSLSDVELNTLKIAKFNRKTLKQMLDMSYDQLQLMKVFSKLNLFDYYHSNGDQFRYSVEQIKKHKCTANGYELFGHFTETQRQQIDKKLQKKKNTANYSGKWNDDIYNEFLSDLIKNDPDFEMVLKYFKQHIHFAYKLVNESMSGNKDLLFIDFRRSDAKRFIDLVIETILKLIGIAFKDAFIGEVAKRPKTRLMQIKHSFNHAAEQIEMDIIYPNETLPSLKELIVHEEDTSFDSERWSLLQWILGIDAKDISDIRTSTDSKFMRVVKLTLKFLQFHRMTSAFESDIILRTEKQHETKNTVHVPKSNRKPPSMRKTRNPTYMDVSWIQTAHKYTIGFELICHCLELCGMRRETTLIRFEAFKFHELMRATIERGHSESKKCNELSIEVESSRTIGEE